MKFAEFLFVAGHFHLPPRYPTVSLSSIPVEIAFSPDRGATELVVKTVEAARKSVRVAAYSFTLKNQSPTRWS